jgi:hypothetical protein
MLILPFKLLEWIVILSESLISPFKDEPTITALFGIFTLELIAFNLSKRDLIFNKIRL